MTETVAETEMVIAAIVEAVIVVAVTVVAVTVEVVIAVAVIVIVKSDFVLIALISLTHVVGYGVAR